VVISKKENRTVSVRCVAPPLGVDGLPTTLLEPLRLVFESVEVSSPSKCQIKQSTSLGDDLIRIGRLENQATSRQ
jgi:hypothetical protein